MPKKTPTAEPSATDAVPDTPLHPPEVSKPPGALRRLGLFGLDAIEAPVLAAVALRAPLLLVGSHGTAKTLLLLRISEALGLECRHYNASLLNFDDLIGFPVPSADGSLTYAKTPAAIWGAGAVIFDEISRCRPEVQNKLFPIVHERKVQGLPLESLEHRWAAMNPPCVDGGEDGWSGSEPLDAALADRFAFVVRMPAWSTFSIDERRAVIAAEERPLGSLECSAFARRIEGIRAALGACETAWGTAITDYVRIVVDLLATSEIDLSPRRANYLRRNILAVHAVFASAGVTWDPSEATLLALAASIPQQAQGRDVPVMKLKTAHREAMKIATLDPADPLRLVLATTDPLRRLEVACGASWDSRATEFSNVVIDALAELRPGARDAAAAYIVESGHLGRLNSAVASQVGEIYRRLAVTQKVDDPVHTSSKAWKTWGRMKEVLATLDPESARDRRCANALVALFVESTLKTPEDVDAAHGRFLTVSEVLGAVA